ncbi:MAG: extracellular solute-binding protein [Oligoflexales bacterium]
MKFFKILGLMWVSVAYGWNGVGIRKTPKHPKDLIALPYVNPDAPKGGRIEVGQEGTFDTLNPYAPKGLAAILLNHLVFQTLGQSVLDDPAVNYPSLGKNFLVAEDHKSLTVDLYEDAKFSDGHPVTAEDVIFSLELFQSDKVQPWYRSYWQDIIRIEKVNNSRIKFFFHKVNPELPMITMELPILPKHIYGKGSFGKDFSGKAIGSGPYVVKDFKRGSSIEYQRNPNFWGNEKPFFRGLYNFNEIVITYYRDTTALVEGLKKGEFDFYVCNNSRVWANDLDGKKFESGLIRKLKWKHENSRGSQAFHWNLRNPLFKDIRVRKALALAFDFEWTNKTLFYGQYKENKSFFENSELAARGQVTLKEKDALQSLAKKFPGFVPEESWNSAMGSLGNGLNDRQRLRQAHALLKDAGYQIKDGVLTNSQGPLSFSMLLSSPVMARVIEPWAKNLKRLGVKVEIDIKDRSVYQKKVQERDFDVIVYSLGQSLSPGNEQKSFWHSDAADEKYSRNVMGLKNPAIDEVVHSLIYTTKQEDLIFYTHLLDRILYHSHIAVHNWHIDYERIAIWDKYDWPEVLPPYLSPLLYLDVMWAKQKKDKH